jgi:DME family drug/metabolite transporter
VTGRQAQPHVALLASAADHARAPLQPTRVVRDALDQRIGARVEREGRDRAVGVGQRPNVGPGPRLDRHGRARDRALRLVHDAHAQDVRAARPQDEARAAAALDFRRGGGDTPAVGVEEHDAHASRDHARADQGVLRRPDREPRHSVRGDLETDVAFRRRLDLDVERREPPQTDRRRPVGGRRIRALPPLRRMHQKPPAGRGDVDPVAGRVLEAVFEPPLAAREAALREESRRRHAHAVRRQHDQTPADPRRRDAPRGTSECRRRGGVGGSRRGLGSAAGALRAAQKQHDRDGGDDRGRAKPRARPRTPHERTLRREAAACAGAARRRRRDGAPTPSNARVRRPRLQALAAAALFSTGGTAIKACSFGPWQVASLRCAFAAATLLVFAPAARRNFTGKALPVAAAYALQSLLFATSNKLTTAADAIFLQSTSPLYVLLLSPWVLGERIRLRDFLFLGALAAGLTMFFVGSEKATATAIDPVLGNVLAVGSGIGWALTILGLRRLGREGVGGADVALQATMLGNVLAFLVAAPLAIPVPDGTAKDWAVIVFLGVVQIALAYFCLTRAARDVPAFELSLLLLLEPVLSSVWAWLQHDERPGPWSIAGAATILAATAGKSAIESRAPRV